MDSSAVPSADPGSTETRFPIPTPPARLVVMGQGYVGLPVALRAAEVGFDVVGFDVDTTRVAGLRSGRSHVEDISDDLLAQLSAAGRYRASDDPRDLEGFDVAVISVPTPLTDGVPDLTYMTGAIGLLCPFVRRGVTIILESTTYPGTTTQLAAPHISEATGLEAGTDYALGYSPERIDPGNPVWRLDNTPKVTSGVGIDSLAAVDGFFSQLVAATVPVNSTEVAELTKLLENTFRHVNIALVNELAMFAHDLGIDVWEAIEAASTKPFGYMKFTPGPGVGGHCLPIDPTYLSWQVRQALGASFRFVELANDVNDHMPDYVIRRVQAGLNDLGLAVRGRTIVLLGLAYKANTSDARETPARPVASGLVRMGAKVLLADPHVSAAQFPPGVEAVAVTDLDTALKRADAVVLLTDHEEFDLDLVGAAPCWVLDCRNRLAGPNVERL